MSGRPIRLVYTPPTWAAGGAFYPAGSSPWSSTAVRSTAPIIAFFTPDTPPSAEDTNFLIGSALDGLATLENAHLGLFDQVSSGPGLNFYANGNTGAGANQNIKAACWDPSTYAKRWLCVSPDVLNTSDVLSTSTDGQAWNQLAIASSTNWHMGQGLAVSSSGIIVTLGYISSAGSPTAFQVGTTGASWSTASISLAGSTPTPGSFTTTEAFWFSSKFVFIGKAGITGGVSAKPAVLTSPDGTTWTDRSDAVYALAGCPTWGAQSACASPTKIVSLCRTGAPGSTAVLPFSIFSGDGVTWAKGANLPSSSTTDLCNGVSWSPADSVFLAAIYRGSNISAIYSSTDGATWTLASVINGYTVTGIACCGSLWVASTSANTGGNMYGRVLVSTDAGVTWALGGGEYAPFSGTPQMRQNVFANGNQFLLASTLTLRGSFISGPVAPGL